MTFKLSTILTVILWVGMFSCHPQDPLPVDTWSQGCIQLAPDPQGFRLSGMCCEYVILPQLKLNKNQQFVVSAEYFSFTGAGFAGRPIVVNGELSSNRKALTISYPLGTNVMTYHLKPGAATVSCFCGCD
jgi:hypothetical protein